SPKTENSLLVDVLIKSGGILLCKTVVAQALLSFECDNPTFGRVTNPYSDLHTPGGSSGGEGALIAKRGAQFGFASDLAGSLRYPAAFCGNYAIKPSSGRLSLENHYVPVTGQEAIHVVAGPICRSVNDVELLMDIVVSAELHKEDPRTLPIPWRKINTPEKLRIGYYFDDGFIRSSPACQRAVLETVESLKLAGHDVVQIQLPDILDAMRIGFNLFAIENMSQVFSEMGSDPKAFSMWMMELAMFLPKPIKKLVGKLSSALGDEKSAVFIESAYHHSVVESWEWQDRRDQYEKKFLKFWNDNCDSNGKELDAIICPVHGMPPVPHDTLPWLSSCMSYSFLYNVLDYPAGIIPVTTLDPELDAYDSFVENSYLEKRNLEIENTVIHKLMASHYDPVSMKGLPIAVQVVGKKLEDEKTVQVMKVVDECLKAYKNKAFN
ncbi:amidase signature domain-containing protein, partial [Paraphysoderma sedebokerense]